MANPQVVVEFVAKTADLASGLKSVESQSQSTGSKLKGMGKVALRAAGAAGIGALVGTLKIGIDEYAEAAKVGAQTESVIKSTGGAAKVTAKHVQDLAGALMEKSGTDDEAIQSGENLLLTFTNIQNRVGKGNAIFDRATKTMLDMSVALGQDTKASAIQLGKALNDPVKGVTALQRVGVSFTEAQKKQIKALVDSGNTLGAQKLILRELNKEFGGSAEAAGKTLPGQLNILKQEFNNMAGSLVGSFLPAITKVANFFVKHEGLTKALVIGVLALAAAMVALNVAMTISAALAAGLAAPVLIAVAAVAALAAIAYVVYKNWDTISAKLTAAFDAVRDTALAVWRGVSKAVTDALNWVQRSASSVLSWLRSNWPYIVGILTGPFGMAVVLIVKHWGAISDAATKALNTVRSVLSGFASWISGVAGTIAGYVQRIVGAFRGLDDPVVAAVGAIKGALNGLISFMAGIVGRISAEASAIANAIKAPINAVLRAWNGLSFTVPKITLPSVKIAGKKIGGGSFGGQTFSFPNVPLLAKGGIVTRPTLAMVGEKGPEAVIPLGAGAGNVEVRVFIGDRELRTVVDQQIQASNVRTARVLLSGSSL